MGPEVWLLTYNLEYRASGAFKLIQDKLLGYYHPERSMFYKECGKPAPEFHKELVVLRV